MGKMLQTTLLSVFIFTLLVACNQEKNLPDSMSTLEPENETVDQIKVMNQAHIEKLPDVFKQIHEKGKLNVAIYSEDRFPYFFVNEQGELIGSDVDLAYDIAYQIGVEDVEFDRSATSYDEIMDRVVEKQVDMAISKISITSNRAQRVLFSEPYIMLKQAVLINRMQFSQMKKEKNMNLDPVEILKTKAVKIGVVARTSYIEFARETFQSAEIIQFGTKDDMLQAVQQGEITAAFYDEFEFKRHVNDHPEALLDLQLIVMEGRNDFLAIAIATENILMQAWLKQYLAYREVLEVDQLLLKYGNQQIKSDGERSEEGALF